MAATLYVPCCLFAVSTQFPRCLHAVKAQMESSSHAVIVLRAQSGRAVYTSQGHGCGQMSFQLINLLRIFVALYVLHQGIRPFGRKHLKSKQFPYPARGASCVALLRPQMSDSEFGDL